MMWVMTQEFQAALLASINSNITSLRALSETLDSLFTEIQGIDDTEAKKGLKEKAEELSKNRDELVAQTNKLVDQYVALANNTSKDN